MQGIRPAPCHTRFHILAHANDVPEAKGKGVEK
jgi:hypothetical protein